VVLSNRIPFSTRQGQSQTTMLQHLAVLNHFEKRLETTVGSSVAEGVPVQGLLSFPEHSGGDLFQPLLPEEFRHLCFGMFAMRALKGLPLSRRFNKKSSRLTWLSARGFVATIVKHKQVKHYFSGNWLPCVASKPPRKSPKQPRAAPHRRNTFAHMAPRKVAETQVRP
jgi:hypothetical protein